MALVYVCIQEQLLQKFPYISVDGFEVIIIYIRFSIEIVHPWYSPAPHSIVLLEIFISIHIVVSTYLPIIISYLPAVHRWELPGNYLVFTVVMVIYHYIERIQIILVTQIVCITYRITNKHDPGEPVNIHIQSLISTIWENNRVITTKRGQGKITIVLC